MTSDGALDILHLARILIRYRLRHIRNAFGARGRGRTALFATIIAVMTAVLYVVLFGQAFAKVVALVDLRGQLAVLALVTGTIAFGSLAARAASSEAVRAGSLENEFYLARPVPLHTLVAARGLADAVTDPVGGLFLLPVLISASLVWRVGALGWPLAIAISMLTQVGISMLAYAVQLAVVRYVPSRRRRLMWTGLRLVAALSLATLWMLGTWVMRAPDALATHAIALSHLLAFSPSMLVSAPLAALARGQAGPVFAALGALALAAAAAPALAVIVARRAGMRGWEEAGAAWADAARVPRATARLPTAATKDLRLIVRDGAQLLALIAMPVIFIGVQVFGAAGWSWTMASLGRVSCFAYSLALYMGTIGPLTHMQAERRAFWILRTVPVPLGSLLAAKARAWAIIIGGIAAVVFAVMSLSLHDVPIAVRVGTGVLVAAGAAGMSFVAVAMASGGADLSDETGTAVGPATIYAYLFVGGLFNLVLLEDAITRVAGLVLYALAGWSYWQAGVEQANFCLDAEAVRARRVRASAGATLLIASAVGGRVLLMMGKSLDPRQVDQRLTSVVDLLRGGLALAVGIAGAIYLARRPRAVPRARLTGSLLVAAGAGALVGGIVRALGPLGGAPERVPVEGVVAIVIAALVDEILLRGIVQRSISASRIGAAAASVAAGVVSTELSLSVWAAAGPGSLAAIAAVHAGAAFAYAFSGRLAAAWLTRVVIAGIAAFT